MHLLNEPRGASIETIVSRLRSTSSTSSSPLVRVYTSQKQLMVRIITLSATLPNIADIVQYTNSACFVATHRPNPLSEYLIVDAPFPVNPSAPIRFSIRRVVCFAAIRRSPPSISRWSLPAGN